MRKVLFVVAALVVVLALILWVISWFRAPEVVATSAAKSWPGGMGTLDSIAKRLPRVKANAASGQLTALANAWPKYERDKDPIEEFVTREIVRGALTIGKPPAIPDVSAIRDLLLREPLTWEHRLEVGNAATSAERAVQMKVARALVASALAKARANDPAAWEDLHAVWKLARSLDGHPQMMEQTAALAMARMINGVAWKMPLPAPPWLAELQQHDHVRPLLQAFQVQTASYWEDGAKMFPTKWHADSVENDRAIAEQLLTLTRCDVNAPENAFGVDLRFVWRRAFRYRAEREATANALRVREGKPIETASQCSDGGWTFDGTTLRFSREIATNLPDRPMPLTFQVKP